MRVLCIRRIDTTNSPNGLPPVHVGDIDEVVWQEVWFGYTYYVFARFTSDDLFRADYFATLPDQTADEMAEQEKEAILL